MPIKINELVIQVKVYDEDIDNKQVRMDGDVTYASSLSTEQQKVTFIQDFLALLEEGERR